MNVDWDQLCKNPVEYEDLVKRLLQRLYRDAESIDGSGGDGGRDIQVRTGGALLLFEAKSFRGRVNNTRRPQVIRSLKQAAKLEPDEWYLVVPIDHTPGELTWFTKLREQYPFIKA